MIRTRTRFVALAGAFVLGVAAGNFGCRTINPNALTHGTLSCSCSGTDCGCSHCSGGDANCHCRGVDAYGDKNAVGEPGDSH